MTISKKDLTSALYNSRLRLVYAEPSRHIDTLVFEDQDGQSHTFPVDLGIEAPDFSADERIAMLRDNGVHVPDEATWDWVLDNVDQADLDEAERILDEYAEDDLRHQWAEDQAERILNAIEFNVHLPNGAA